MTLGMTKYDNFLQIGQALKALLTSIPEVDELLRQFLIQEMQNGWSHSDRIPNFLSAVSVLERTRSRQTLHSMSWLCFKDSRCFCFFSHAFKCSSLSSVLKGCKHCFPHVGHKSPWIRGQFSPRGQSPPAAAKEQIGISAGPTTLASPFPQSSRPSGRTNSPLHAVSCRKGRLGISELASSLVEPEKGESGLDNWEWATERDSDPWDCWTFEHDSVWETLTWSYLHRLPKAHLPFW